MGSTIMMCIFLILSASFDTWTQVCEDYALQLESDGQYHYDVYFSDTFSII